MADYKSNLNPHQRHWTYSEYPFYRDWQHSYNVQISHGEWKH